LSWLDGDINLIPLPDNSIEIVTLIEVASEFIEEGDRLILLNEIWRILKPEGQMLIAERVQTPTNYLVMGLAGFGLEPASYWQNLLEKANFSPTREVLFRDLILCLHSNKPLADQPSQLMLEI
jgi:ubiquinone/menaquinone biosynthesis C-methylase UbiE